MLKRLSVIFATLFLLLAAIIFLQDKITFFPHAWPAGFVLPETLTSCTIKSLTLKTPDGINIDAILASPIDKQTDNGRFILFSHGNAGNLLHRLGKVQIMCQAGFSVFLYDYRGFGRSTGSPDVPGAIIDGQTSLKYLSENLSSGTEKIVLYGESLGTGIAAELLRGSIKSFAGVVLESGFASLAAQANRKIPGIGSIILKHQLPTIETIKNYHGPLLVIHSRKDSIIPFSDSEKIYAACPAGKKRHYIIENAGHNDPVWEDPQYLKEWQEFADSLSAAKPSGN